MIMFDHVMSCFHTHFPVETALPKLEDESREGQTRHVTASGVSFCIDIRFLRAESTCCFRSPGFWDQHQAFFLHRHQEGTVEP